jgi:uncharacterized membrane protein (UPF0127 family)
MMHPAVILLLAALYTNVTLQNGKVLNVEVAASPEELTRGLMGRKSLPPDSGMLFVYKGDLTSVYNLMGYAFAVDLLYLDEEKRIVNLKENAVPCRTTINCGYNSTWMHRYALQLPAGTVKRLNIHAGDIVSFEVPSVSDGGNGR